MTTDLNLASAGPGTVRRKSHPGLLRRGAAARFLAISPATLDRHSAAGKLPAPVKIGGCLAWNRRELKAWIDHGCPDRAVWTAVWAGLVKRRAK